MMFNTGDLILDAVILSILARTPEGTYGYKITQDVRSKMDVPESTFYPLLKQMQMDGYLEVYHKDIGGRSRRFYKITESGLERLEFCQQNWANYLQNASSLLMPSTDSQPEVNPIAEVPSENTPAEPEFHISSSGHPQETDFSIGGDNFINEEDSLSEDEGDLFEFDLKVPETAAIAIEDETGMDDEADFLAEMALGDADEIESEQETVVESSTDSTSELESLLSQLRSFETKITSNRDNIENTAPIENNVEPQPVAQQQVEPTRFTEIRNPETDESVNSLVELLKDEPVKKSSFFSRVSKATNTIKNVAAETANAAMEAAKKSEEPVPVVSKVEEQPEQIQTQNTVRYEEIRNPETDETVNSLVDLLKNDEPAPKARFFKPRPQKEIPVEKYEAPKPVVNTVREEIKEPEVVQNVHKIKLTEVRSPETDEAVNSLVDLLKDDDTSSKPKLFRAWGGKSSSPSDAYLAPKPEPMTNSTVEANTVEANTVEKVENEIPARKIELTEVRNPETDEAVNSLVDLLKDDDTSSKPKLFRPRSKAVKPASYTPEKVPTPVRTESVPVSSNPEPVSTVTKKDPIPAPSRTVATNAAPVQPVAETATTTRTVREVPGRDNSVDSLVELLKAGKTEAKPMSIFGKTSAKTYTKVEAPKQQAAPIPNVTTSQPVSNAATSIQNTAIPKPVVSEPKAFEPKQTSVSSVTNKPTATKTFEAKAASSNAKPVETRATITKPLEAKAISTKPTVAKPAEAKSVETKAVVTPKAEPVAKADTSPVTAEKKEEEIPMDSFRYRLMQANLLPDQEK